MNLLMSAPALTCACCHAVQGRDSHDETMFGGLFLEAEPASPGQTRAASVDVQKAWGAVLVACIDEALPALQAAIHASSMADLQASYCLDALICILDLGLSNHTDADSAIGVRLRSLQRAVLEGEGFEYAVRALLGPAKFSEDDFLLGVATLLRRQVCQSFLQRIQLGELLASCGLLRITLPHFTSYYIASHHCYRPGQRPYSMLWAEGLHATVLPSWQKKLLPAILTLQYSFCNPLGRTCCEKCTAHRPCTVSIRSQYPALETLWMIDIGFTLPA